MAPLMRKAAQRKAAALAAQAGGEAAQEPTLPDADAPVPMVSMGATFVLPDWSPSYGTDE